MRSKTPAPRNRPPARYPDAFAGPVRKEFFRRLGYMGLAVVPIVLLWRNKGPERFIALGAFLLLMYQLILLLNSAQLYADIFFPPRKAFERTERPSDRYFKHMASGYFFTALVLLTLQIRRIDNTFGGLRLFWIAGAAGILLAIVLTGLLRRLAPTLYDQSERRFTVHAGIFLGSFLLLPAVASVVNYQGAPGALQCRTYRLLDKRTSSGRNTAHYLIVDPGDGTEERLDVGVHTYDSAPDSGPVELCTRQGALGFPVVEAIQPRQ